jgi:hypothetical protein
MHRKIWRNAMEPARQAERRGENAMRYYVFALALIGILAASHTRAACFKPEILVYAGQTDAFASESDFDKCRIVMPAYRDGSTPMRPA